MPIRKSVYLLILFVFIKPIIPERAFAGEQGAEIIYSFADYLFNSKDYYRAITEYKRLIFHYPDHRLAKYSKLKIGNSYKMGKRWDKAIFVYEELEKKYPGLEIGKEGAYRIAEISFLRKKYRLAIDKFNRFRERYPVGKLSDRSQYNIGWSYFNLGDYSESSTTFNDFPLKSGFYKKGKLLAKEIEKFSEYPRKSPLLAGLLSAVIPGAGQIYTERYNDGFVSFLLNGLFIWGIIESVHNDNNVTAGVLALFEFGWYAGNIYNATSNAHKYNRNLKRDFINNLNKRHDFSSRLMYGNKEIKLALNIRF